MLRYQNRADSVIVYLQGEIDHCAVAKQRNEIEKLIKAPNVRNLTLDFSQVSFMDSSGVGMIIGRYKTISAKGGCVYATGLHPPVDRLFYMAGLHRIIITENTERRENA